MRYSVTNATIEQVRSVGAINIKEARRTGIIFTDMSEAQAARLRAMGCNVSKVGGVKATVMPPTPVAGIAEYTPSQLLTFAGLDKLRGISDPPILGENFNLAIIDSGIRETHNSINGHVVYSKNFTSDPMRDGLDHGTGVTSIAIAVAPLCNILNLKVLNDEGVGTEEEVVLAIEECLDLYDTQSDIAPTVINLSLGSPDDGNPNNPMRVACRAALERNILVAASAGNDGPMPYTITSPACERYVIAVGSARPEPFEITEWSSRGPTREGLIKPDVVLFGENIVMASSSSDNATTAKSGTSFAVPFGSAMLLMSQEGVIRGVTYPQGVPAGLEPGSRTVLVAQDLIDYWFPRLTVKPAGVALVKDNDYGSGLPFGDLLANILRPAVVDISIILPIIGIAMLGMMMGPMVKAFK